MHIKIIDANNHVRVVYEANPNGSIRQLLMDSAWATDLHIWVFDGKGARSPRLALYPEYKATRKGAPDEFYKILNMVKGLTPFTKAITICVPGYEADDVIAHLVNKYAAGNTVKIHSTDGDFLALCHENVTTTRQGGYKGVPASEVRLFKTLVGDPSDNIKGLKGFADKSWQALQPYQKEEWLKFFNGEPYMWESLGMSKATQTWFENPENQQFLRNQWAIVGFLDVPQDLINEHTTVGQPNWPVIDSVLKEFMH